MSYKLLNDVDSESKVVLVLKVSSDALKEQKETAKSCLNNSRRCGLVLGCIVGCFLESAVLGACFVMNEKYGADQEDPTKPSQEVVTGALLWCLFTGIMAATVCLMLRNMVWTVFTASYIKSDGDETTRDTTERLMHLIVRNVDSWFGIGCLMGTIPFWLITFLILGMKQHMTHSLWVGAIAASAWVIIMGAANSSSDTIDDIFDDFAKEQKKRELLDPTSVETAVPLMIV